MSMDCLSYFFDWDPPVHQLQDCFIPHDMDLILPETDTFFFQSQTHQPLFQEEAPLGLHNHLDPFYNMFLPPQETFLAAQETFLPSPKTEIFNETHTLDSFLSTSKRQKLVNSSYHCNNNHLSSFLEPYELEATTFHEFRVPDFSLQFKVGRGDHEDTKKPTLSSQSIAARERRRKIAEKTHELGKLIPGGQKLNTAEMFQAAAKYVKFLQSQVGILQLMQTTRKKQSSSIVEVEAQGLLGCQAIQEKLLTEEMCLVPTEMLQDLAAEETIWRNPRFSREINKFGLTNIIKFQE